MKVFGTGRPAHKIDMRLDSLQIAYRHYVEPYRSAVGIMEQENEGYSAEFIFDDTREIDLLIDLLQKFKKEAAYRYGEWR